MVKGKNVKKGLFKVILSLTVLIGVFTLLTGCGATHTAINKRKMDVQTKMSSSVFLEPVTADKKRLYLQVRNTSGKTELDLESPIAAALEDKGYCLVQDPEQAHYLLQTNVLQVGRSDLRAAEHALSQGFGATIGGAVAGAAVGSLISQSGHGRYDRHGRHHDNNKGIIVGGLVGAAVATVGDAMIQDVVYSVVADVQISERVGNSVKVKEKTRSKLKLGVGGAREVSSTQIVDWHRYQTRVVGTANKVNLKFEKAAPLLADGLTRSIVGIF